jgi:hypothetical protein
MDNHIRAALFNGDLATLSTMVVLIAEGEGQRIKRYLE